MDIKRKLNTKTLEKKKLFQKEKSLPTYVPAIQDSKTCVVRLKKIDGKIYQDCDVYIGPKMNNSSWEFDESPWVNIFHYATSDRINNLKLYREHVMNTPALRNQLHELRGKRLGCFCENLNFCHGTVLCKLVEEDSQTKEITTHDNYYFFKGEENPLSNLYKCSIKYGDTEYFCSEHFRCMKMAERLQSRKEMMEQVKKATTIQEVCRLSKAIFRTLKRCRLYTQAEQIVDMINTLNEKWYACEEFREKLKSLRDGMLIFEATRNNFWGCGTDITEINIDFKDVVHYEGENILGWALYYVRAKFEEKAKEMEKRLNTFKRLEAIDDISTEQIELIQAEKKCMEHRLLKPEAVLVLPSEEEKEESQRLRRDRMLKSDKGLQNLIFDYRCFTKSEEQCAIARGLKKVIDAITEHVSEVNIFLF